MTPTQSVQFSNIGAVTPASFTLKGGTYAIVTKSTGAGTIDLNILAGDGSTYIPVITQIAATTGFATAYLPPGLYQVVISGFTANYVTITTVPI